MRKLILTGILFSFAFIGYNQENVKSNQNSTTEINNRLTEAEKVELKKLKGKLEAIDYKENWIRSNPEEVKIAQETNWFKNAEATRKEIRKRIKELENK